MGRFVIAHASLYIIVFIQTLMRFFHLPEITFMHKLELLNPFQNDPRNLPIYLQRILINSYTCIVKLNGHISSNHAAYCAIVVNIFMLHVFSSNLHIRPSKRFEEINWSLLTSLTTWK